MTPRPRQEGERHDGDTTGPRVVAAITAAGESRRMGQPKALLSWRDGSVLAHMVATIGSAGLPRPAVVVGAALEAVSAEVRRVGARPLANPDYHKGRFSSVRVAARWALDQAATADAGVSLMLWPVDCPVVMVGTLLALRCTALKHPRANLVPAFDGHSGHPVVLCAETLAAIVAAPEEANLRELVSCAPEGRLTVTVDDPAVLDNLNTMDDYRACRQQRLRVPTHVE